MYTNKLIVIVKNGEVQEVSDVGVPAELTGSDATSFALLMGKVAMSNMGLSGEVFPLEDPDVIKGDYFDGQAFTKRPELRMSREERVLAGYDDPPEGFVVADGTLREMTVGEKLAMGLITQAEFDSATVAAALALAEAKLSSMLSSLMSVESLARSEIDAEYATARKATLAELLAVRGQEGWPISVNWPDAI